MSELSMGRLLEIVPKNDTTDSRRIITPIARASYTFFSGTSARSNKRALLTDTIMAILGAASEPERLVSAMMLKYPAAACIYCRDEICSCPIDKSRPDPDGSITPDDDQRSWSLDRWARLIDYRYGPRYRTWSERFILSQLTEEIQELWRARDADEFYCELADCLNRALTLANVWGLSAHKAVMKRVSPEPEIR